MDTTFKGVPGTLANLDGLLFHFVEGDVDHFLVLHMITTESYHVQSVLSDITIAAVYTCIQHDNIAGS